MYPGFCTLTEYNLVSLLGAVRLSSIGQVMVYLVV